MRGKKVINRLVRLCTLLGLAGMLVVGAMAEGGGPMPDPNPPRSGFANKATIGALTEGPGPMPDPNPPHGVVVQIATAASK